MNDQLSPFLVPANYTDSGRVLGMFKTRNFIDALIVILVVGYPEVKFITLELTIKAAIICVTMIPLIAFSLIGISGDSLFERLILMIRYCAFQKKYHFKRVGYCYDEKTVQTPGKISKALKQYSDRRSA